MERKRVNADLTANCHYYLKRCSESHTKPNVIFFARQQQKVLKSERKRIARQITEILGYELIEKQKIRQYTYLKSKKIKINGKAYAIIPLKADTTNDKNAQKRTTRKNEGLTINLKSKSH